MSALASNASNANVLGRKINMPYNEALAIVKKISNEVSEKNRISLFEYIDQARKEFKNDGGHNNKVPLKFGSIPKLDPQLKQLELREKFFDKISILKDVKLCEWKVKYGENAGKTQTNLLNYQSFAGDNEMLSILSDLKLTAEQRNLYQQEINNYIATGGSDVGQFTRLMTGLNHNLEMKRATNDFAFLRSIGANRKLLTKWTQDLIKVLPWLKNGSLNANNDILVSPNYKANAGLPFSVENKGQVLVEIDEEMKFIAAAMSKPMTDREIHAFDEKHADRLSLKIKNKFEIIAVSEVKTKIRNYYVSPAGSAMHFSIVHELYNNGVSQDFNAKIDSWQMCGFAWTNRGADKLMKNISHSQLWGAKCCYNEIPKFHYVKIYSDDLHLSVLIRGREWFFAADVKYLDLSLSSAFIPIVTNYFLSIFVDDRGMPLYDELYKNIIRYNVIKMFQSYVLLAKGVQCYKADGLNSGVPGTTNIGTIATSCAMLHLLDGLEYEREFGYTCSVEEFSKKMVDSFALFGMTIKPGTEIPHTPWYDAPENTITTFKILGQNLKRVRIYTGELVWLPLPDEIGCLNSLLRPQKQVKSPMAARQYGCERALGICVSGGYQYPNVYDTAKKYYEQMRQVHNVELDMDNLVMDVVIGLENIKVQMQEFGVKFPPKEWFEKIYVDSYEPQPQEKIAIVRSDQINIIADLNVTYNELKLMTIDEQKEILAEENISSVKYVPISADTTSYVNSQTINKYFPVVDAQQEKRLKKLKRKLSRLPLGIQRRKEYNAGVIARMEMSVNNSALKKGGKKNKKHIENIHERMYNTEMLHMHERVVELWQPREIREWSEQVETLEDYFHDMEEYEKKFFPSFLDENFD